MKYRPIFLLPAGIMPLTACQREAQPPRQTDCIIKVEQPTEDFEDDPLYTVLSLEEAGFH